MTTHQQNVSEKEICFLKTLMKERDVKVEKCSRVGICVRDGSNWGATISYRRVIKSLEETAHGRCGNR